MAKKITPKKQKFSVLSIFKTLREKLLQISNILTKKDKNIKQINKLYQDIVKKVQQVSNKFNKKYNTDNTPSAKFELSEAVITNFINELKKNVSKELLQYTTAINDKIKLLVDNNKETDNIEIKQQLEKLFSFYKKQTDFVKENVKKIYIGESPIESLSKSQELNQLSEKINSYIDTTTGDDHTFNIDNLLKQPLITKEQTTLDKHTYSSYQKSSQINIDKLKNLDKLKNKKFTVNETKNLIDQHRAIKNNAKKKNTVNALQVTKKAIPYINAIYTAPQIVNTNKMLEDISKSTDNIYEMLFQRLNRQSVIPAAIPVAIPEIITQKHNTNFYNLRGNSKKVIQKNIQTPNIDKPLDLKIPWSSLLRLLFKALRGLFRLITKPIRALMRRLTRPLRRWWKNFRERIWNSTFYRPKKPVSSKLPKKITKKVNAGDEAVAAAKKVYKFHADELNNQYKKQFNDIWDNWKKNNSELIESLSPKQLAKIKEEAANRFINTYCANTQDEIFNVIVKNFDDVTNIDDFKKINEATDLKQLLTDSDFKFGKTINDGIENAKLNRKDLAQLLSNAGDSATAKVQKLKQFNALSSAEKTKILNERISTKFSDQIRHAKTEVIYKRWQCESNKLDEKI